MKPSHIICFAVSLLLCLSVTSRAWAKEVNYKGSKAVLYAANYNGSGISPDNGYNSDYKCWNGRMKGCENYHVDKNGVPDGPRVDCANFASQALIDGGIDFNIYDKLKLYVTPLSVTPVIISKTGRTVGFPLVSDLAAVLWRSYCFEFITDPAQMVAKAKPGDILSKTRYSHVMVYGGDGKYYAHTNNRSGARVSWTGNEGVFLFHFQDDDPTSKCIQYDGTIFAKLFPASTASSSPTIHGPGGDHPDDTFSVGTTSEADKALFNKNAPIGILDNGFSSDMLKVLSLFNREARLIPIDGVVPSLVAEMPLMIIPSGGLSGLSDSQCFKAALDEYVNNGGTVFVLSQQHGYEYSVIPGGVGGYGWTEDQSCQANSSYIDTWHQILAGQTNATPSLNVDGYFTSIPANATVLLRRTANGQPALITYSYGNGRIIATSVYTDFAYSFGQAGSEEIRLIRDIVSWANKPAELQEIKPGESINQNLSIANGSVDITATAAWVEILAPDGKEIKSSFKVPLSLAPGQTMQIPINYSSATADQPGICHIKYSLFSERSILLTSEEEPDGAETLVEFQLQAPSETDSGRFVVSNPPPAAVTKPLTFKVNAPTEKFAKDSTATFTWHIWNNGDTERTVTVRYGFPHHTWETGDQSYGNFSNLSRTVTVPAKGEATFDHTITVRTEDQLFSYLYDESNNQIGQSNFKIWRIFPSLTIGIQPDKTLYSRGETVSLALNLQNRQSVATTGRVSVRVSDPSNLAVYATTLNPTLAANESRLEQLTFSLPASARAGNYTISAEAFDAANNKIGGNAAGFELPLRLVSVAPTIPAVFNPGANTIPFTLTNTGFLPVAAGTLTVTLADPDGASLAGVSRPFALDAGQSSTIDLQFNIPALKFGNYTLAYTQSDETNTGKSTTVPIPNTVAIAPAFDKPSYRIRETANIVVSLENTGKFPQENMAITVSVPDAGCIDTKIISLASVAELSFSCGLPENLAAGQYPVSIAATLPSGSSRTGTYLIAIPDRDLKFALDGMSFGTGNEVKVSLSNAGGVDSDITYSMKLYDSKVNLVYEKSGAVLATAGSMQPLSFLIPDNVISDQYEVVVEVIDKKTNNRANFRKQITISGISAGLKVITDKETYLTADTKTALGDISVVTPAGGQTNLNLKALVGQPWFPNATPTGGALTNANITKNMRKLPGAEISNDYIDAMVAPTGIFTIGTTGGDPNNSKDNWGRLLAVHPSPWSSLTTVKVDNNYYVLGRYVAPSRAPYFDGNTIVTEWTFGKVKILQRISIVYSDSGNPDIVQMEYVGKNEDTIPHDIGYRMQLDTWVGTNDGSPFQIPNIGNITSEQNYTGSSVPPVVLTMDSLTNPTAVGKGIFDGLGAVRPDRLALIQWWPIYNTAWDFTINPSRSITYDSAIALWWNGQPVATGQERTIRTLYGVGAMKIATGQLSTTVYAPSSLVFDPTTGSPTFTVSAYIQNNTGQRADNVIAKIQLPDGLMVDGGLNEKPIGSINPNQVASVDWRIRATGSTTGELNYSVVCSSANLQGNTSPAKISVPPWVGKDTSRGYVVWEKNVPVNLDGSKQISAGMDIPNITGKFQLVGSLYAPSGQLISQDSKPFYAAAGNYVLIAAADKLVYRPGETSTISGEVRNLASVEAANVMLKFKRKGGGAEEPIYTDTFSIPANGSHPFTFTATAGVEEVVTLTGTVTQNNAVVAEVVDRYEVAAPQVTATVSAPEISGYDPFTVTLEIKNNGKADALVTVLPSITLLPETVTIPAGQTRLLQYNRQVSADTTFNFTLTGDLTQTFTKTVKYGPAVVLTPAPQAIYPEGNIALPITIGNGGLIDSPFTVTYLLNRGTTEVGQQTKNYFLPKGASSADTLLFDLAEGSYSLAAASQKPAAASTAGFQVRKQIKAELALAVGAQSGNLLPATVTVTNLGFNPIEGSVRLSLVAENGLVAWTAVQEASLPQSLAPSPQLLLFTINLSALKPGTYVVSAELLDGGNRQLAVQTTPFTLRGPVIAIGQLPEYRTIPAGGSSDFTFTVKNSGNQEGSFELSFKADDLVDSSRSGWLKPGEERSITFSIMTAADLEEKDYTATWRLKAAGATASEGVITYRLAGIKLVVTASLDRVSYTPGDTATLTLNVSRQDGGAPANLFARVNYDGYNEKQTFTLDGSQTLVFSVPLTQITGEKLFYGIYAESGRSLHLNTLYIYKADGQLAVTTDKQVYSPGETVAITSTGTASGDLTLTGPGDFSTTFAYSGTDTRSFTLPATMVAGTYTISAKLTTQNSQLITATHPFDVTGIQVKVKEALLDKSRYAPTDTMQLTLTIESNQDLSSTVRTWVVDPAGNYTAAGESVVELSSAMPVLKTQNSELTTASLGIHKLVYGIYQGDLLLASGAKAFDIGEGVLLGLATDRSDYGDVTLPVTVKADLYGTVDGGIEFFLDGVSIRTDNVALSGIGNYTFAVPPASVPPGLHTLKGVLTVNGLTSSREVRFTYGSSLPDLIVRLSSAEPKGSMLPLVATVSNQGKTAAAATTLVVSDGSPAQGGATVATLAVPPLAGGASATISHDWNLLGKAGDHTLYAQVDPENLVAEFIEANNGAIRPVSIPSLTLGVSTGGTSFQANSDVGIVVDLANLGSAPYQDLTLNLNITSPVGAAGSSETAIASLAPASGISVGNNWNTGANPPGNYRVDSSLVGGGNSLASGSATFAVEATTSVTGSMSLDRAELIQGAKLGIDCTLANNGNIDLSGGEAKVEIVDKNSGTTSQSVTQPFAQLNVLQSLTRAFAIDKLDVPPGDYTVKLTALTAGGGTFPIEEKALKVLPSLEVIKQLSPAPRVLVFIGKEEGDNDNELANKEATIRQALDAMGVYYALVRDEKGLRGGLRSGFFNSYLLAGRKPLADHLDEELAERINSGDGLILAGYGTMEDVKFREITGIESAGSLPAKPRLLTLLDSPMTSSGSYTVTGKVEKLRVNATTAQVAASVVDKGESYPAVVLRPYGKGKVVVFTFEPDVVLLQSAVGFVAPTGVDPIPATPLPVELTLKSLGAPFELKVTETVDPALPILQTYPLGTLDQQTITWTQSLGSNGMAKLSYVLGLPDVSGTYALSSVISYLRNGSYEIYKSYPLIVQANRGLVTLKTDILASLQGLAITGKDTAKLAKIIGAYAKMIDKPVFTGQQVDEVIRELLVLTGELQSLQVDTASIRSDLDRLLRIYGYKWSGL